jgi:hypothetical protein
VLPGIAIEDTEEGAKGGKKRCKQCHQETATVTDNDGGTDKQAGGSGGVRFTAATGSSKRQAHPPIDHFKKLLKETCPNYAYPVKHKLRDCNMMKTFMTTGSPHRSMEVDEAPGEGDTTHSPGEDTVMTIYGGCPSLGMHHTFDPSLGIPSRCGWGSRSVEI